jgi:hypothetical protein
MTGEPERVGGNRVGGLGTERVYPQTTASACWIEGLTSRLFSD